MTLNGGILFDKSGTGAEVKDIKRNVVETCEKSSYTKVRAAAQPLFPCSTFASLKIFSCAQK